MKSNRHALLPRLQLKLDLHEIRTLITTGGPTQKKAKGAELIFVNTKMTCLKHLPNYLIPGILFQHPWHPGLILSHVPKSPSSPFRRIQHRLSLPSYSLNTTF